VDFLFLSTHDEHKLSSFVIPLIIFVILIINIITYILKICCNKLEIFNLKAYNKTY